LQSSDSKVRGEKHVNEKGSRNEEDDGNNIPVKAECDFVPGFTYECCFGDDPVAPSQHLHQQQCSMQLAH
jgi:hypothetical protein